MKKFTILLLAVLFLASCGDAIDTAYKEFKPSALLKKYEWFKDAASQLDKKNADIQVYKKRMTNLKEDYKGVARKDWPRDERQTYDQWENEYSGTVASYNDLAAEYNSQMAKFNWQFCNAGTLPQGATVPLPREFRAYKEE